MRTRCSSPSAPPRDGRQRPGRQLRGRGLGGARTKTAPAGAGQPGPGGAEDAPTVTPTASGRAAGHRRAATPRAPVDVSFDVLECADLDEAIQVAAEHPLAVGGRRVGSSSSRRRSDDRPGKARGARGRRWPTAPPRRRRAHPHHPRLGPRRGRRCRRRRARAAHAGRATAYRNPAAWLTTTARRRALDVIRRAGTERSQARRGRRPAGARRAGRGRDRDHGVLADDRLRLVFTCCHPALRRRPGSRSPRRRCRPATAEVAGMFLVPEPTMGQRLLRAKKRIAHAGIPYRVPEAADLAERLDGVLGRRLPGLHPGVRRRGRPRAGRGGDPARAGWLADLMPDEDEARGCWR